MQAFILDVEVGHGAAGRVEQVSGVDGWWVCRWWRKGGGAGEGSSENTARS